MLLIVWPQVHSKLLGSLNFFCLILKAKFQGEEAVFSWIDIENRVKEDSDFPGCH